MPAVKDAAMLDKSVANKLDICPAEERVCEWYDVPDLYVPGTKGGREGEVTGDDGVVRQKCGGGYRVIKKKISN